MTSSGKVSVVVRAKNEARWLDACLHGIRMQDYPDIEIILVDNDSTDQTVEIGERHSAKLVNIPDSEFNFSRALNWGIEKSTGDTIAIISGHCVPVDETWLSRLVSHFSDPKVAAVYGRQEPLPDSEAADKRDLWITFGLDRKVQRRDHFFHNANSAIRRNIWERLPFNEEIHGVEDQDWARKILREDWQIIYEPYASVYHHHGIHHNRSEERAARVVRVIELIQGDLT